jgi:predicted dienelactone hydrolase
MSASSRVAPYALAAVVLALGCARSHAQTSPAPQRMTLGGRNVVVWTLPTTPGVRSPVVVFSHGYLGCATQSKFLMEALASHGYWVVAPQHNDATCRGAHSGQPRAGSHRTPSFFKPEAWSDSSFVDRAEDVRAVIDAIARDSALASRLDLDRLALVGHSLGGYTVVGLAGGWASWRLPHVRAVLALSPYTEPFVKHNTLGQLSAPIMYQGGTLDWGITPFLERANGTYDESPAPKYFVDFAGAGHFAWTDFPSPLHDRIIEYSLAFLDYYVRGTGGSAILSTKEKGVSDLRYDSELGKR